MLHALADAGSAREVWWIHARATAASSHSPRKSVPASDCWRMRTGTFATALPLPAIAPMSISTLRADGFPWEDRRCHWPLDDTTLLTVTRALAVVLGFAERAAE